MCVRVKTTSNAVNTHTHTSCPALVNTHTGLTDKHTHMLVALMTHMCIVLTCCVVVQVVCDSPVSLLTLKLLVSHLEHLRDVCLVAVCSPSSLRAILWFGYALFRFLYVSFGTSQHTQTHTSPHTYTTDCPNIHTPHLHEASLAL